MATSSTLPAVKAALVSLGRAAINDNDVQVTYSRPADSFLKRNCVWVGRATGTSRVPTIKAGRKAREENYSVEVVFWVAKPRGTAEECELQAHDYRAAFEDVLADDPSLGNVDGLVHASVGAWEAEAEIPDNGPYAIVTLQVACVARLS